MATDAACTTILKWAKGRAGEWSTWRGIAIVGTALVTAINPAAGLALGKAVATVLGSVEIVRKENADESK